MDAWIFQSWAEIALSADLALHLVVNSLHDDDFASLPERPRELLAVRRGIEIGPLRRNQDVVQSMALRLKTQIAKKIGLYGGMLPPVPMARRVTTEEARGEFVGLICQWVPPIPHGHFRVLVGRSARSCRSILRHVLPPLKRRLIVQRGSELIRRVAATQRQVRRVLPSRTVDGLVFGRGGLRRSVMVWPDLDILRAGIWRAARVQGLEIRHGAGIETAFLHRTNLGGDGDRGPSWDGNSPLGDVEEDAPLKPEELMNCHKNRKKSAGWVTDRCWGGTMLCRRSEGEDQLHGPGSQKLFSTVVGRAHLSFRTSASVGRVDEGSPSFCFGDPRMLTKSGQRKRATVVITRQERQEQQTPDHNGLRLG